MRRAKLRAAVICAIVIAATATVMISSAGTAAQAQSGSNACAQRRDHGVLLVQLRVQLRRSGQEVVGQHRQGVEGEVPERQAQPGWRRRYRHRRDEQGGAALPLQVAGARRPPVADDVRQPVRRLGLPRRPQQVRRLEVDRSVLEQLPQARPGHGPLQRHALRHQLRQQRLRGGLQQEDPRQGRREDAVEAEDVE